MALLGNLLGTVDGLLGTATGALSGGADAGGSATAGASGSVDLSHTLDVGALIETNPSIDVSASGLAAYAFKSGPVSSPAILMRHRAAPSSASHCSFSGS